MREHYLEDEAATSRIARQLAAALPASRTGWLILLRGELGAGKSTLARAMLRSLGHDGPVPSPTYTLVEPYDLNGELIYHVDLYRVADAEELEFLGWSELRDGMVLLEWPERAESLLKEADLSLEMAYSGDARRLTAVAGSARGGAALERLDSA